MSRIVTFYSYKGGVGRTLALANIGVLLAKRGKRVLLMDWDLEAPGLDRYFKPFLPDGFSPGQGVIYLLHQAMNGEETNWKAHVQEIVVSASGASSNERCALSVIPSGVASPDYADKVRAFSWSRFLEEREGGPLLEKWRNEWKKEYDFVLIDSRTGITDTGGICTVLMPDFLVLVFTANDQSFEGALGILNSIHLERRNLAVPRPPLMVLPLLSRFDRKVEVDESDKWLARFSRELKFVFDDWLPRQYSPSQILELTKIPYITRFSFGEPLPVLTHGLTDPELPGFYLENVARLIRTDFREAAQIIDPKAPSEQGVEAEIIAVIQRIPIDEVELLRLLRDAEQELGESPQLASLFARAGIALHQYARFASALPLMRRALVIAEQGYGPDHPLVTAILGNLASLFKNTNRLAEAEPLMRRVLAIDERNYGPNDPNVAIALGNLALLLQATNRSAEAEPLMRRALAIMERIYGTDHPDVATSLNNLAGLLQGTNRSAEAEPLMRRALAIMERSYESDHPDVAIRLGNLAGLLQNTNRSVEAEPLMRRALAIMERSYGPDHPQVATSLNNLATLLQETNRSAEAEPLLRQALAIDEQSYGPDHPDVAIDLNNLAALLQNTNRLEEAESLMRRHLGIFLSFTRRVGHDHPHLQTAIGNYRHLLTAMSLDEEQIRQRIEEIGNEIGVEKEHYRQILDQAPQK